MPLPRSGARRRALTGTVRELPLGTPVVLLAPAPGASWRCRAFAKHAGLQLECGYLAFPSAAAPGVLVEDAPATVRAFVDAFLVAPPRPVLSMVIDTGIRLVRRVSPWRLVRALAPGRVVVGRRA